MIRCGWYYSELTLFKERACWQLQLSLLRIELAVLDGSFAYFQERPDLAPTASSEAL